MISQKSFVQTNIAYITMVRFITVDSVTRIKFNVIRHNTVIGEGDEYFKKKKKKLIGEFKKLRQLLQRKRHFKIELCRRLCFAIVPSWYK